MHLDCFSGGALFESRHPSPPRPWVDAPRGSGPAVHPAKRPDTSLTWPHVDLGSSTRVCSLTVYQCIRIHSPHPPWPAHSFPWYLLVAASPAPPPRALCAAAALERTRQFLHPLPLRACDAIVKHKQGCCCPNLVPPQMSDPLSPNTGEQYLPGPDKTSPTLAPCRARPAQVHCGAARLHGDHRGRRVHQPRARRPGGEATVARRRGRPRRGPAPPRPRPLQVWQGCHTKS